MSTGSAAAGCTVAHHGSHFVTLHSPCVSSVISIAYSMHCPVLHLAAE